MACATDYDCGWHARCTSGCECEALPLFTHPLPDVVMGVLSFVIAGISLAAGVGGGGMFVPLLMIFLSFDAKVATALSQSMLLGGAIAALLYNLDQTHPHAPARPLVDFQLACLLGAILMAGSQVGSVIHAVAPAAVLLLLLCAVLIHAACKGFSNAKKASAKEGSKELGPAELSSYRLLANEDGIAARVSDAKRKLVSIWVFCAVVVVCRNELFQICSLEWWVLVIVATFALSAFAVHYAFQLSKQAPLDEHSLDFQALAFPLVKWGFLAGILAAVCGIGGGMVMGPILVGMRVPPPVSSATTATTLLVLSSSTALVYICRGVAPGDYSVYLSAMTTLGALTGKVLIGRWIRRTGKDSVLVWALFGITVVSTLLMGSLGIFRVYSDGWEALELQTLCTSEDQVAGHQLLRRHQHAVACGSVVAGRAGNSTVLRL